MSKPCFKHEGRMFKKTSQTVLPIFLQIFLETSSLFTFLRQFPESFPLDHANLQRERNHEQNLWKSQFTTRKKRIYTDMLEPWTTFYLSRKKTSKLILLLSSYCTFFQDTILAIKIRSSRHKVNKLISWPKVSGKHLKMHLRKMCPCWPSTTTCLRFGMDL